MTTLNDIWNRYKTYTTTLSNVCRQLAIINLAVYFVLQIFPMSLLHAVTNTQLKLVLLFFILDVMQYISGAYSHFKFAKSKENEHLDQDDVCNVSEDIHKYTYIFFKLKILTLFLGYVAFCVNVF